MKNKIKILLLLPCLALVFSVATPQAIANEPELNSIVELKRTLKQLQEKLQILKDAQPLTKSVSVNYPVSIYFGGKIVSGSSTAMTMTEANKICKEYKASRPAKERLSIWCAWRGINFTNIGAVTVPSGSLETTVTTVGENDDQADYTIAFDVTAMYGDVYLPKKAFRGAKLNSESLNFLILNEKSELEKGGETTTSVTSTADTDGGEYFVIREGETEIFKLNVSFKPSVTGDYKVQLQQVSYLFGKAKLVKKLQPGSDYSTDLTHINGDGIVCPNSLESSECSPVPPCNSGPGSSDCTPVKPSTNATIKVDFKQNITANGRFVVTASYEIKNHEQQGLGLVVYPMLYDASFKDYRFNINHEKESHKEVRGNIHLSDKDPSKNTVTGGYWLYPSKSGKGKITFGSCHATTGKSCIFSSEQNVIHYRVDLFRDGKVISGSGYTSTLLQ